MGFFQIDEYSGIEVICDVTLMRLILRLSDNVGRSPQMFRLLDQTIKNLFFKGKEKELKQHILFRMARIFAWETNRKTYAIIHTLLLCVKPNVASMFV